METSLALSLRWGVLLAVLVCLLGEIRFLLRHGSEPMHVRTFHGEPAELRTPSGILDLATHDQSRGIIQLGLLLIAVPVTRIAFSAYSFLRERDWIIATITFAVPAGLLFSLCFER